MNENYKETPSTPVVMNEETKKMLLQTARWAKIIAIINFISCGLIVLVGIGWGIAGAIALQDTGMGSMQGPAIAVLSTALGIICLVPTLYLYRYSNGLPKAFADNDIPAVNTALNYHRRYYRFSVILMIVTVCLTFMGGVIIGSSSAF